jgi:UDP-glucose 4-epimerase
MGTKKMRKILVTGGAGYIGSHMVRLLLENGYQPVVFDNLSTGHRDFIPHGVPFVKGDLRRGQDIRRAFRKHRVEAVIHFAASIVVPESVSEPLKYYENNVAATMNLLQVMDEADVRAIVFSSSACVYGEPLRNPITEDEPLKIASPYGATKVMVEQILRDLATAGRVKFMALRYFNVAGAHPSGEIGIKMAKPTHLIPNVMRALSGSQGHLTVYGQNYKTKDGTGVRDYVYVVDLCQAHLLALKALKRGRPVNEVINIGTGTGNSVKEVFVTAEKIVGHKVPVVYKPRRPGDCGTVVASFAKARRLLGWRPRATLKEILLSAWAWEQALRKGSTKYK